MDKILVILTIVAKALGAWFNWQAVRSDPKTKRYDTLSKINDRIDEILLLLNANAQAQLKTDNTDDKIKLGKIAGDLQSELIWLRHKREKLLSASD